MPQCSWKALRDENVTQPPYKIHGNSKNVTEIPKLSCVADFKRNFQSDCMFPSSAGERGWKDKGKKQFIRQNERTPTFSIGHRELIISLIVSNHQFMPQIQAKV